MLVFAATGLFSLVLSVLAVVLLARASTTPPAQLRSANRRSPEGYAFHDHRATIRRQGWYCALAAVMTLGVCLAMGLIQLTYAAD